MWALEHLVVSVIVEPMLAGLEAGDHRVAARLRMVSRVLAGGTVATADVATLRATPKVQPPSAAGEAFDAAGSAGLGGWVDSGVIVFHGGILPLSEKRTVSLLKLQDRHLRLRVIIKLRRGLFDLGKL
jgi:hypothetical protein